MPETLEPGDHDDKDIKKALQLIVDGAPGVWTIVKAAHWGTLRCRDGCCSIPIFHTPKNPTNFARGLVRDARRHPLSDDDPRNKRR